MSEITDQNDSEISIDASFQDALKRRHHTLSLSEVDEMRRNIRKRINRKNRNRLYYWSVAAAAGVALLLYFKFQNAENTDMVPVKQDIAAFAEMSRPETKPSEIHLVLSDEQTLSFNRKETEITYDTDGIVVDREIIAKSESTGFHRLSRFYGVETLCDPSLAGVVYSGKLDLTKDLPDIIKGISFTLSVSFSESNGKYFISRI